MSDSAQIVLIVAGGLVLLGGFALFLLKDKIGSASVKGSKNGVSVDMKTHAPARSSVSGNVIKGDRNALKAQGGAQVDKNQVDGSGNTVDGK